MAPARPRYPKLEVAVRSANPLALVAGVREQLRRAGVRGDEIADFTEEALAQPGDLDHALEVAKSWIGSARVA
jgi:hypothetical protein